MIKRYKWLARGFDLLVLGVALAACGHNTTLPATQDLTGTTRQIQLDGRTVTVEVVGGLLLYEGDIEVGTLADLEAGTLAPQSLFHDQSKDYRWPGGVIPFIWDTNITAGDRATLTDAMTLWSAAVPAIRFVSRSGQSDYIRFKRLDGVTDRCSSKPGRQGGEQVVWLMETGPCGKFGMVHELGHALGLFHEQSREDRDLYVTPIKENVQPERWPNFEQHISDGLDIGPYDYDSIMHYGAYDFCLRVNGVCQGPTLVTIPAGIPIGQRTHLSVGDVAAVKWLYLRDWVVSDGGQGTWRTFSDATHKTSVMALGDFNGDGRTDFFRTEGCVWYVSYSQLSGPVIGLSREASRLVRPPRPVFGTSYAGPWTVLSRGKCESLSSLRFGDFDGDRKTDVFVTSGGVWYIAKSGVDWWTELNSSSLSLSDFVFGDFDGDGRTDVFRGNGSAWYVSWGGATAWQFLNTSSYRVSSLGLGDFNGDGRTDVLRTTGSQWQVSYSGSGAWQYLNSSSATLHTLRFGYFGGDAKTDIYRASGSSWQVSYGGSSSWQPAPSALKLPPRTPAGEFFFGDFDGNGSKDVFAQVN